MRSSYRFAALFLGSLSFLAVAAPSFARTPSEIQGQLDRDVQMIAIKQKLIEANQKALSALNIQLPIASFQLGRAIGKGSFKSIAYGAQVDSINADIKAKKAEIAANQAELEALGAEIESLKLELQAANAAASANAAPADAAGGPAAASARE